MSVTEIQVEGTFRPDGTIELDRRPNLIPGRVTIILRQESDATDPNEDWWQFMQRTRRELEAAGQGSMNDDEVNAHIQWLREGDPTDESLRNANGEQT